jgi:hypothetical protein
LAWRRCHEEICNVHLMKFNSRWAPIVFLIIFLPPTRFSTSFTSRRSFEQVFYLLIEEDIAIRSF